jgi:TRAP-type C4-dicarboxylate transport system permease small subunit
MRVLFMKLSAFMSIIAGIILVAMILITFADIIMRFMGSPIPGVYEVIAYLGVAVAGLALPRASMMKTHVYVDLLIDRMSGIPKKTMKIFTRILVCIFFLLTGWYLMRMGISFVVTKTVTMMLRVPYYPVVFAAAFGCFVQCAVSIYEMFEREGETNE